MRYGDALPEGFNIPTSAFWLQKDLTKNNPFALVSIVEGDAVMDCGAYIGTFSAACLEQGAGNVTCYEAAPKNALLLRENLKRYDSRVAVIESALTDSNAARIMLMMSGFSGANSILPSPNKRKAVEVSAINFRSELLRLRPSVVKLDVEGAEYALLGSLHTGDLTSVRMLFIEFHPIEERETKIDVLRAFIEAEGFIILSSRRRAFVATREDIGLFFGDDC